MWKLSYSGSLPNFFPAAKTATIQLFLPQAQKKAATLLTLRRKPESKQPVFASLPQFQTDICPLLPIASRALCENQVQLWLHKHTHRLNWARKVLSAAKRSSAAEVTESAGWLTGQKHKDCSEHLRNKQRRKLTDSNTHSVCGGTQTALTRRQWWQCDARKTHWRRTNNQCWGRGGGREAGGEMKLETQPQKPLTDKIVVERRLVAVGLCFGFYGNSKPIGGSEIPEQQPITAIFAFED